MTDRRSDLFPILGVAVLALGVVGVARLMTPGPRHPADSAPGRTAKRLQFGGYQVTGRTVTIDAPRDRIHAMWRDPRQLALFMQDLVAIEGTPDRPIWVIDGGHGPFRIETRLVEDRASESLAWRSVEGADFQVEAKIRLRDAPAGRGTEVEAHVAYVPPYGLLGHWAAKLRGIDPKTRGRQELKRLKMLLETGEIATASNQRNT
ncbi:cyclase (plasmid) [Paracoccus liaowanqingii]|uniref:Cyclase n=1 Tax=Paracoccus liaowanqingii TaxID=2560053 RepID=A0A4Y5SV69_9RHOB|nr:SRPBCC family protein [Paracoccus liaowanqingii]QDA36695.1 cyclase [Paracoccus liaowanqingii]